MSVGLSGQARRDWRRVGLYFGGVVLLAPLLAFVLSGAWATRGLTYHVVWLVVQALGVDIYALILFLAGLYLGWLGLLWGDAMKRKQAALLTVATVLAVGFLRLSGRWSDTADVLANLPALAVGIAAGLVLGGGLQALFADGPHEFRAAALELFGFVGVFAVVGLFERHLLYTSPIQRGGGAAGALDLSLGAPLLFPVNLVGVVLFVLLLRQFVTYDSRHPVAFLSPAAGGQTSLALMLYDRTKADDSVTRDPEGLVRLHRRFVRNGFDALDGEGGDFEFTFQSAGMFPEYVTLRAADYRMDDLDEAAERAESRARRADDGLLSVLRADEDSVRPDGRTVDGFLDRLFVAETVLVLLPLRDLVANDARYDASPASLPGANDPDDYLDQLGRLLDARTRAGSTEVVPVATMADVLVDEYESDYDGQYAATPSPMEGSPSFSEFVGRQLRTSDHDYARVLERADEAVYPVWFHLDEDGQPERTPDASLETEGARELVDRLSG